MNKKIFLKKIKKVLAFYGKLLYYKQVARVTARWQRKKWLVGQAVKTPPSHGGNRGSIPLRAVILKKNSPTQQDAGNRLDFGIFCFTCGFSMCRIHEAAGNSINKLNYVISLCILYIVCYNCV